MDDPNLTESVDMDGERCVVNFDAVIVLLESDVLSRQAALHTLDAELNGRVVCYKEIRMGVEELMCCGFGGPYGSRNC